MKDVVEAIENLQAVIQNMGSVTAMNEPFLFGLMGVVCGGMLIYAILHNM